MDKVKITLAIVCVTLALTTVFAFGSRMVILFPTHYKVVEQKIYYVGPQSGIGQMQWSIDIHATIKQYRWIDGVKHLIYTYSHPAALTQLFENLTAAKITGHSTWNLTDYANNVTQIALGHSVGLGTTSTVLPGEWNRTAGTFEYIGVGHWNYSASFYPSGSGSTNATSMNWLTGIGTDLSMAYYDTFTTIDYTANDQIDVEWEVDIQYS